MFEKCSLLKIHILRYRTDLADGMTEIKHKIARLQ